MMNRRQFIQTAGVCAGGWLAGASGGAPSDRPNILWITCEDMSPNLGCYGDAFAVTPNLDRLAAEGVRYTGAFTHAPVCAPSRSGLITGMYPMSIGSHHMRSKAPLPPMIRCFTAYLREAGYYCSNCFKEDYNFDKPADSWDDSSPTAHWRNRAAGRPFFSVFNLTVTHEGQIRLPDAGFAARTSMLKAAARHDPGHVAVPPYHPDVPEVRRDWARYYDLISVLDVQAGEILDQLESDGLADDTVVFFFSDHGAGMPRSKRWLYDTGVHVPLLVRFPDKYRDLAPGPAGTTISDLVAFVDFGPSVLSLAGVAVPAHMQGRPFLGGQAAASRRYVYGGRDRMDERYDCSRYVRDGRYKYIRNLMPHLSRAQYLEYLYQMPTMQVWARLARDGKLDGAPSLFMQAEKPVEELYDLENDRWELHNLAGDDRHAEVLRRMRGALVDWMQETRDLGLLPESEMFLRGAGRSFYELARDGGANPTSDLIAAAGIDTGAPPDEARLLELLEAPDAAVRYWAVIGLRQRVNGPPAWLERVEAKLADSAASVRIAAAELLLRCGRAVTATPALEKELQGPDKWARLASANVLDAAGVDAPSTRDLFRARLDDENPYVVRVARHRLNLPVQG